MAVDQDADTDQIEARIARSFTVQGMPEQIQKLTLGASMGGLSVVLRGSGADKAASAAPMDRRGLLGEPEPAPTPVKAPAEPAIRVIIRRGGQVEVKTRPDRLGRRTLLSPAEFSAHRRVAALQVGTRMGRPSPSIAQLSARSRSDGREGVGQGTTAD